MDMGRASWNACCARPLLAAEITAHRFIPSFSAFRTGKLQWSWDSAAINEQIQSMIRKTQTDDSFKTGLLAAFSAAVFDAYYGTETTAADLRREYPLLFAKDGITAGLDAQAWLIAIGWKADQAPFRPMLQLIEPVDVDDPWQLKLILQDKLDQAVIVPVKLSATGEAYGSWPASWSPSIRERSSGWLERLRACLPTNLLAGKRDDILNVPLKNDAAWRFLAVDSPVY